MSRFLRMIVLAIVLFTQVLTGVNMGVSAETTKITALSLLQSAENVKLDDNGFISSINEIENADPNYWMFYVNGESALEGPGTYEPKVGDVVSFKYESYPPNPSETTTEDTIKIVGLEENSTALSLLKSVETAETDETGFLSSINGLPNANPYYWMFYVNGKSSLEGAGRYEPVPGDVLSFKYESYITHQVLKKYTIAALPIESIPPTDNDSGENCENPSDGTYVERAAKWTQISKTGVDKIEEAIALRHLGEAIPQAFFDTKNNELEASLVNNENKKIADYHNFILSLVLSDKDPANIVIDNKRYNLLEKIYNNDSVGSDIYTLINALTAIDSNNFEIPNDALWSRDRIISGILANRNNDSLWSWSKYDPTDIDTTAMVIRALAPHKDRSDVREALEVALNWLSSIQLENGGFNGGFGENSSTAAYVLTALTALGIDPKGEQFTKSNGNLVDYVTSFILEDGSFAIEKGGKTSEDFATPQGLLALASYERFLQGKGSIYNLSNLPSLVIGEVDCSNGGSSPSQPGEIKKQTITISVRTHESTILSAKSLEVNEDATALSALLDALGSRVEVSGGYVAAIDGLAEFAKGPTSGWKYSVNGYFPGSGAGSYELHDGDQLEWVYVVEDKEAAKDLAAATGNAKPEAVSLAVFESFEKLKTASQKLNAVLNKDQKMSAEAAQKLKQALSTNTVKLEKSVNPVEETFISHPTVDEANIIIPKYALTEQKTIKIEELPETVDPAENIKSSIYQFSPKGTKFEKPVYISINIPIENEDLDNLVMAWLNEETNEWIPIPTVIDAKTGLITGQVDHFTKFAVIEKTKVNKVDVTTEMKNLIKYLQDDQTQSEWEDFGLARLNQANNEALLAAVAEKLKEANGSFRKITDYERYALTVKALGGDPTNIGGYNLIEKIYNNDRMTLQGTNGLIFALIALDSGNYQVPADAKWSRETILAEILASQNNDGGFSLVKGEASDVDITAMALSSLVNDKDQASVKAAIDKAVAWLSKAQQESGGFIADGKENSESAVQVIIALTANGIDPQGELFTKAKGNVVSNLLSYQNEKSGGFANLSNEQANQIASEQALLALTALNRFANNESSIYKFTDQIEDMVVSKNKPDFVDATDISKYAIQSVYDAYDKGIMYGVGNNPIRFAPQQSLTRAQFTAILVKLLEGEDYQQTNIIFDDVKPGQWYYGVVMRAHELGIVGGTSETKFSPNEPITREQVAVLLARAFKLEVNQSETKSVIYKDISKLNDYNQAAIQAMYDHNLMKGYENGLFRPKDLVTREMGAALAVRLDDKF